MNRAWAQTIAIAATVVAALFLTVPVHAQTGSVRGKVVDDKDQPVQDAKIVVEFQGGTRRLETKTSKKGEFIQIGLASGAYKVTAEKEGLGSQTLEVRVRVGDAATVNFVLAAGMPGVAPTKEAIAKGEALKKTFEEGVAASQAGKYDDAIEKFTAAAQASPNCADCYYNIGIAHLQKKEYDKSEAAFKKTLEVKPDYLQAYSGLTSLYNAQKKFDEAAAASAAAAKLASASPGGGGNAQAIYNQAVSLWNGGKIPEAKKLFQDTVAADPTFADAHYWLGMANVNEGKMPEAATEFEMYLKLAPDGQYSAQAKTIIEQIKK